MARTKENVFNLGVCNMLKAFQLRSNEMLVYNLLSRKPMTIRQLQKSTRMSERSLRTYMDDLVGRNFVSRKLVKDSHLKYVYSANSGENLLDTIKKHIDDIEKNRLKRREEIIKGTSASIDK